MGLSPFDDSPKILVQKEVMDMANKNGKVAPPRSETDALRRHPAAAGQAGSKSAGVRGVGVLLEREQAELDCPSLQQPQQLIAEVELLLATLQNTNGKDTNDVWPGIKKKLKTEFKYPFYRMWSEQEKARLLVAMAKLAQYGYELQIPNEFNS